jgi:predicted permease
MFSRLRYIVALRLRSLVRRDRVEDDLADEMRFHLEERTRELIGRGMSARDAHDAALRAFGGVEQRKEECRDARRVGFIEDAALDVRYALRTMRRAPAFTAIAIASLAIGIGANTAIFSAVDALLLKPLPVQQPDELRVLTRVAKAGARTLKTTDFVPYEWVGPLRQQTGLFSDVLAFADDEHVQLVSSNFFDVLGREAQIGRVFADNEQGTAVLGDRFWRRTFNGDQTVIGKSITLHGVALTVIGVAAKGFFGLRLGREPDAYVPLATYGDRADTPVVAVGRLQAGVADRAANERLTTLSKEWGAVGPNPPPYVVELKSPDTGLSDLRERFMRPLTIVMVMVGGLLLIGCANVATMLLSRASARRTEIVIRSAIGAGRGRLLRQLTTESALLVTIAAIVGMFAASWATSGLLGLMQLMDSSLAVDLSVDRRSLFFTAGVSAIAAVIAGLSPARHAAHVNAGSVLRERREAGATAGTGRFGHTFVVVQVALALTLVVAAGLFVRTLYGLAAIDAGFRRERIVLATVHPGERGYKDTALRNYFRDLQQRLQSAPGVESATLGQFSFLSDGRTTGTWAPPGYTSTSVDDRFVQVFQVGSDFFSTMGITIVEGRDFTEQDMAGGTPHAIAINQTAAQRYFNGRTPVGQVLGTDRIIAVVRDARYNTLRDEAVPVLFYTYPRANRLRMTYAVRVTSLDSGLQTVSRVVRDLDPAVPAQITTIEDVANRSLAQERVMAVIGAFFGATALLLLSLGLYGVMAFSVSERTAEIGVRVALGARRAQVVWSVLRRPLAFVLIGAACGVLLTIAGGRLIAGFLFGLAPQDPLTILGASLLLMVVAGLAGFVPARRAASVDPVVALRNE